jgi:hypothetical protein
MVKYKKKLDEDIRCQFEYGLPAFTDHITFQLCKVIPNYAENVNKSTITEILQNCCKCRKYSKIKRLERF